MEFTALRRNKSGDVHPNEQKSEEQKGYRPRPSRGVPAMKNLMTASALALCSSMTWDETIGISIVNVDDNFQTLLRTGLEDIAAERGVDAT